MGLVCSVERRWALWVSALGAAHGCTFNATPLFEPDARTSSVIASDAGAHDAARSKPSKTMTKDADSGVNPSTNTGVANGTAGQAGSRPTTGAAAAAQADAGSAPVAGRAGQFADAGCSVACAAPAAARCDAVGSYGLRMLAEVSWDTTTWVDSDRGPAEFFALLHVDSVDVQTHALAATLHACKLTLPEFDSSSACSRYQLQVPDAIWGDPSLPGEQLAGSYDCDTSGCSLRFDPVSSVRGITLSDAQGPWPEAGSTSPLQFPDDDSDNIAGVSVDIFSKASVAIPDTDCGGEGDDPISAEQIGRMPLGLRAQLRAALKLDATCTVSEPSASAASIDIRAANCLLEVDAITSPSCNEMYRNFIDESLPSYETLARGEEPSASDASDTEPSTGSVLQVVRFAPGEAASCEAVRAIKF